MSKSKVIVSLIVVFLFTSVSFSQYKKYQVKSKREGLADYIRPFNFTGWYVAPGVTLTPKFNALPYTPTDSISKDGINYNALDLTQKSQLGLYLEVGRYKLLSSKLLRVSYIDYGLAYKQLKGTQTYNLDRQVGLLRDTTSHEQNFSMHNIVAHFNANHVIGINKNIFFQNTLGLNVDYAISRKITTTDATGFFDSYQTDPSKLMAQLHYKFGIGFRVSERFYLIPSVETPILNIWKFEGARGTLGFFNSRYRPIIISLRIAWLTKPSCPKTWGTQGEKNDGGKPKVW
jgi:hypothetical protein